MKKIIYILIFVSQILYAMENTGIPDYTQLPIELWMQIIPDLIITEKSGIKNYDEIKKMKGVSKYFYCICDSDLIHKCISPDLIKSALILNTKNKCKEFDNYFYDENNLLPIFQAAVRYRILPIIQKAIDWGADPNTIYGDEYPEIGLNFQTTALCRAAEKNDLKMAEVLLKHALTDPNVAGQNGETPLIIAAKKNHDALVKRLLKHPFIDPQRVNREDKIALTVALNNSSDKAANILILDRERRKQKAKQICLRCAIL